MILRLDPRFPLVWRTPTSLQLGIDPAVVLLEDVTAAEERMIAALVIGVSGSGLTMMANGIVRARDQLLRRVAPALARPLTNAIPTVAVPGLDALPTLISEMLASKGVRVIAAARPADLADIPCDLAVICGHFVLNPELHALWLRRDIPHLPVIFSDTGVVVGPMIEPGFGPCLLCLELHRRDEDEAWPAMAAQLLGRRSRVQSPMLVAEGAAVATRMTLQRLRDGTVLANAISTRIDGATGECSYRGWALHPECGCRGIESVLELESATPGRRETGSPGAGWPAPAPG